MCIRDRLKVVAVKDIALNAESMLTRPDDDGVTIGELRKPQFAVQQEVVQVDVGAHAVTALDHNINEMCIRDRLCATLCNLRIFVQKK